MPTRKPVAVSRLLSGSSVPRLLDHARVLADLEKRLQSLLPEPLGTHCRVLNLRDHTLTLAADSSAWAARLRYQTRILLQQLARSPSVTVRTIQVRILPTPRPEPEKPKRNARLSSDNARLLRQTAESLADPALRSALLKVATRAGKAKDSS